MTQLNHSDTHSNRPTEDANLYQCYRCREVIQDSHLLQADGRFWHEDCLRCNCCDCRLGEVGSSLYTKADLLLCRRDYLRMFGTTGYCAACDKVIPAFELVMRAQMNVYHLECFACQNCNHRFCVGDRFYLIGNQIMCEMDYEEAIAISQYGYLMVPTEMTAPPEFRAGECSNPTPQNIISGAEYNALMELKHQTESLPTRTDDSSSGYGSPSPTCVNDKQR